MGSLAQFIPDIEREQVRQLVATTFAEVFDIELISEQQTTYEFQTWNEL